MTAQIVFFFPSGREQPFVGKKLEEIMQWSTAEERTLGSEKQGFGKAAGQLWERVGGTTA